MNPPVLLPIYMFHRVAPAGAPGFEPYLCLTPEQLDRQVRAMQTWGFRFLTLDQAVRVITGEEIPPRRRCAVLTFDDLDLDFARFALPVLRARRAAATGFLVSAALRGGEAHNLPTASTPLAQATLETLVTTGIEIGSHTLTHRELPDLPAGELERELAASKAVIEDATGRPCTSLCYPRGRFGAREQEAARRAGYTCACATLRGNLHRGGDRFALKRIRAHGGRCGLKLRYTTWRIYDWLNRGRCRRDLAAARPWPAADGGGEA